MPGQESLSHEGPVTGDQEPQPPTHDHLRGRSVAEGTQDSERLELDPHGRIADRRTVAARIRSERVDVEAHTRGYN